MGKENHLNKNNNSEESDYNLSDIENNEDNKSDENNSYYSKEIEEELQNEEDSEENKINDEEINNSLEDEEEHIELNNENELFNENTFFQYLLNKNNEYEEYSELLLEKNYENQGINFLDVKSNLLISYCIYLQFYLLLKIEGKSVVEHPVIRKLIYLKTLISKLKPIEKKIEYQINKLLKIAKTKDKNIKSSSDPLKFKPKPNEMSNNLTTEYLDFDENGEIIEKDKNTMKYRPLKLSANLSKQDQLKLKKERQNERQKKHLLRNSFVDNLHEEFSENPFENKIRNNFNQIFNKEEEERIRFEEENFIRLPVTKKEKLQMKKKQKNLQQSENLDNFNELKNIRNLLESENIIKNDNKKEFQKEKLKKSIFDYNKKKIKKSDKVIIINIFKRK